MANQPTRSRPWFRLASIRVPTPAPAPIAEPRAALARPTVPALAPTTQPSSEQFQAPPRTAPLFPEPTVAPPPVARTVAPPAVEPPAAARPAPAVTLAPFVGTKGNATSVPSSPVARVSAASASLPTSPAPRAVKPTTAVPISPSLKPGQANGGPNQPPKSLNPADETYFPSPKMKLTARPPSPLTLPPSQLKPKEETDKPEIPVESDHKTVLVQRTIEKPKSSYDNVNGELMRNSGEVRKSEHEASKKNETRDKSTQRKVSVSEDGDTRVIILAGENKGAVMELTQSSKKHGIGINPNRLHEKGSPTMKTAGRQWDTYSSSSNKDENVKRKDKSHEGQTKASSPLITYMNSNVQGVNNSIMYHSKFDHSALEEIIQRRISAQGTSYRPP